ncbi:hypothetical protein O181_050229 [Austropuccinia psidii MF-1]|uniref:Phosphoglycerate mutase-like protein n=1 Tax=Austropuccinia psidii MF-1 TaxID=1389203 RepID=A0A9Q3DWC4_9BASI|nr:hypothetical protein [Austropuccinia psidii MF-1]
MDSEKLSGYQPVPLDGLDEDSAQTNPNYSPQGISDTVATKNPAQLRRSLRDFALGFFFAIACYLLVQLARYTFSPAASAVTSLGDQVDVAHSVWFPTGSEIGYQGPIKTGIEPFAAVNAPVSPGLQSYFPIISPIDFVRNSSFDPVRSWGYLSPFHTLPSNAFGLDGSSPKVPQGCQLEQVHLLHRHGARYPTRSHSPIRFSERLKKNKGYKGFRSLSFLNDWEYGLGIEILTPFGRNQLFNLGVGFRQKYGHLLDNLKNSQNSKLVFRTTSQHRMLHSGLNFAAGFFGFPFESQYHQSILIEAPGFNNTLAPYFNCKNNKRPNNSYVDKILANWSEVYLEKALPRLQADLTGYSLSFEDLVSMQELCAYESVSLGFSPFCQLFTPEEFRGFSYYSDLLFWYGDSFGCPTAAAIGKGWVEELVSRLTRKPIKNYDSSTNSTLDSNPITFPLDQPIYVDATHDTVISSVIVALNLTTLAREGPLPTQFIPKKQSFVSAHISPFSANLQVQVVKCHGVKKVRFLLNDAPVPLTGLQGCLEDSEGFCLFETAIRSLQIRLDEIDFFHDCNAPIDYVPPIGGGGISNGRPSV